MKTASNYIKVVSKKKDLASQKAARVVTQVLNYYVNLNRQLFLDRVREAYEKGTKANLDLPSSRSKKDLEMEQ